MYRYLRHNKSHISAFHVQRGRHHTMLIHAFVCVLFYLDDSVMLKAPQRQSGFGHFFILRPRCAQAQLCKAALLGAELGGNRETVKIKALVVQRL